MILDKLSPAPMDVAKERIICELGDHENATEIGIQNFVKNFSSQFIYSAQGGLDPSISSLVDSQQALKMRRMYVLHSHMGRELQRKLVAWNSEVAPSIIKRQVSVHSNALAVEYANNNEKVVAEWSEPYEHIFTRLNATYFNYAEMDDTHLYDQEPASIEMLYDFYPNQGGAQLLFTLNGRPFYGMPEMPDLQFKGEVFGGSFDSHGELVPAVRFQTS